MSNKNLPIKIIEKRKGYDERSTEGGGDNKEPGFVLHGEALHEHAQILSENLKGVRSQLRNAVKTEQSLPTIMSTQLNESAIAKTHRGRIVNILESDGNDNVVGVLGDREILSILTTEVVLDNLENAFQKDEMAILTSSLSSLELFQPYVEEYDNTHLEYRARVFDYNDFDSNNHARMLFENYCDKIGVQIQKKVRFTADMYIYRVTVNSLDKYLQLQLFEGLYSIEKSSILTISFDFWG